MSNELPINYAGLHEYAQANRLDYNELCRVVRAALAAQQVPAAMKVVTDAMRADPEYAWSWHCNIAMAFVDEGGDHAMANHAAARFMRLLADVEPAHKLPEKAAAPQAPAVPDTWSVYVATMIGAYLGWGVDDERIQAVAGIIERRRWAAQPAQQAPTACAPCVVEETWDWLRAEKLRLETAIRETLAENAHLADGEDCTLIRLKQAMHTNRAACLIARSEKETDR